MERNILHHQGWKTTLPIQSKLPQPKPPSLMSEVEDATKHLKTGKAPGLKGIPSEFIIISGPKVKKTLLTLCTRIWLNIEWPSEWKKQEFFMIPKAEDS